MFFFYPNLPSMQLSTSWETIHRIKKSMILKELYVSIVLSDPSFKDGNA